MAYRRTDRVAQRLAARHDAIIAAAREVANEGGMAAVQIAAVAERAGIAAGTVYRYFPAKTDLVAALVAAVSEEELAALRRAADAAPGPLSALAAVISTFAWRLLRNPRLAAAVLAESVDADADSARLMLRRALAGEFETGVRDAITGARLPEQDAGLAACAVMGVLIEGSIRPLAKEPGEDPGSDPVTARTRVQSLTLLALRTLGVADPRARGLVVQTPLPAEDAGA